MQIEEINLDNLTPYQKNPRANDKAVDIVATSIKEYGMKQPIVVDSNNVIVVGNTRWKALKKLGHETAPVIRAEDLTKAQIKGYRLMDNKSNELADWDENLLPQELQELKDMDFDIELAGFEDSDLPSDEEYSGDQSEKEESRKPFNDERDNISEEKLYKKYDKIIIGFSGGKDSIVTLLHALEIVPKEKIEVVSTYIPFDYPDLHKYKIYILEDFFKVNYKILGKDSNTDSIKKYGFPSGFCKWCNSQWKVTPLDRYQKELKKHDIKFISLIGTRAEESSKRAKMRTRGVWGSTDYIFPIFDYKDEDIVRIINEKEVPVFWIYKYINRLGCYVCPEMSKKMAKSLYYFAPELYFQGLSYIIEGLQCESYRNSQFGMEMLDKMVNTRDVEIMKPKYKFNKYWTDI